MDGMFGEMKLRVVSLFKMAHNNHLYEWMNNGVYHKWIQRELPSANWVILCGPLVKAPSEIKQRGFQGFRYCTELF